MEVFCVAQAYYVAITKYHKKRSEMKLDSTGMVVMNQYANGLVGTLLDVVDMGIEACSNALNPASRSSERIVEIATTLGALRM